MEVWGRPPLDNELETIMNDTDYDKAMDSMYGKHNLQQLAEAMRDLAQQHEDMKNEAALVWKEYDYLRMKLIPKAMEDMGIENVTIKGVGRLKILNQAGCKTLDKDGLMTWFREHDLGDMIQEVINASTLKAFVKEQIREGNEIPGDDLIEFTTYDVASITKN